MSTVRNWIWRRQIYGAALLADGKINAALARRQLAERRDATRGRPPKSRPKEAEISEPPPDDPLFQLRLEKERLEIRRREVALDVQLGRYVLADEVRANRRRALAEIVQMTEAWLPTLISANWDWARKSSIPRGRHTRPCVNVRSLQWARRKDGNAGNR